MIVQPVVEPMDRFAALVITTTASTKAGERQPAGECGGLRLDLCPAHFLRWPVVVLRYQWVPFMFSHQLLGARSGRSQGCGSWVTSPPTAAAQVHSFSLQTGNNE